MDIWNDQRTGRALRQVAEWLSVFMDKKVQAVVAEKGGRLLANGALPSREGLLKKQGVAITITK